MAQRHRHSGRPHFPDFIVAALIVVAWCGMPSVAAAENPAAQAVCSTLRDSIASEDCRTRLQQEECQSESEGRLREACEADIAAKLSDPAAVQRDNMDFRSGMLVSTKPAGQNGVVFVVAVPAGIGSDVPPTHTEVLLLSCAPNGAAVTLSLSRPAIDPSVQITLDSDSYDTGEWRHDRDTLSLHGAKAIELIQMLRRAAQVRFIATVADDQPYTSVFDLDGLEDAAWPIDYLCP